MSFEGVSEKRESPGRPFCKISPESSLRELVKTNFKELECSVESEFKRSFKKFSLSESHGKDRIGRQNAFGETILSLSSLMPSPFLGFTY